MERAERQVKLLPRFKEKFPMPPSAPRVASPTGTPISPGLPVTVEGAEGPLILLSVLTMLFIGSLFLLGVWFFLNRLKNEQAATNLIEGRSYSQSGTGSHPDAPVPGRDFTPQADMNVRDD
jgi:hypothetical protein